MGGGRGIIGQNKAEWQLSLEKKTSVGTDNGGKTET